jgi:uncharacterized cupin superfamily protein
MASPHEHNLITHAHPRSTVLPTPLPQGVDWPIAITIKVAPMPALKPPALDPLTVPPRRVSDAPEPYRALLVAGRERRILGPVLGLTNFGVNLSLLPPGGKSSLRHWHTAQDEFVYVLEGEVTLVTDTAEQVLTAGMCAGFPKNNGDGHHLVNRSAAPARYLEVGDCTLPDECHYSDDDLLARDHPDGSSEYLHKDGRPY